MKENFFNKTEGCTLGKGGTCSSVAAGWSSLFDTISAVISLFTFAFFGSLSDIYGRQPVLCLMTASTGLLLTALWVAESNLWVFFTAEVVLSFFGSLAKTGGLVGIIGPYVADCVAPDQRTRWFGYLIFFVSIAVVLGPVIGSLLYQRVGKGETFAPTLLFAAIAAWISFAYALFFLPESKPKMFRNRQRRSSFVARHTNAVGTDPLSAINAVIWKIDGLWKLIMLTVAITLANSGIQEILLFYLGDRFGISIRGNSVMIITLGAWIALIQVVFLPALLYFRWSDRSILILSLFCISAHYGAVSSLLPPSPPNSLSLSPYLLSLSCRLVHLHQIIVAPNIDFVYAVVNPLSATSSMAQAAISGIIADMVPPEKQGLGFGAALGSSAAISSAMGPGIFGGLYALGKNQVHDPSIPFYFGLAATLAATVFAACSLPLPEEGHRVEKSGRATVGRGAEV